MRASKSASHPPKTSPAATSLHASGTHHVRGGVRETEMIGEQGIAIAPNLIPTFFYCHHEMEPMRKRRDGEKCDFHSLSLSLSPPSLCLENSVDQRSSAFVISTPFCLFPCKLFQAQASLVASLKRENGDVSFLPRTSCAKKLPAGVQRSSTACSYNAQW